MKKPNLGTHFGSINNSKSFEEAYAYIISHPDVIFATTGNSTPFTARATVAIRGNHVGEKVIRFFTDGEERARAYSCCWGHKTNCGKTHIDCYTLAI